MGPTRDLASLVEENLVEMLVAMGRAGGGETRDDDEITWTIGGSPIGYHNAVARCTASADRAMALVEEWRDRLDARGLPGSWHLSPAQSAELDAELTSAGFEHAGDEPAMVAALDDQALPRATDLVDVRVVDSASGLDAYRVALGDGFGEGPKEADWAAAVFASLGVAPPWRHLVGYVGDEPVATASVLVTGAAAGIYFVSTRPAHRGKGIGAQLTKRAMAEARALGARYAVLEASAAGQPVYERLGFGTLFTYRLFEREAVDADASRGA